MATKAKLEVLTGETFDKSYIKGPIATHGTPGWQHIHV